MNRIKIYHNPKCSKSRQALAILNDREIEAEVIEYLKTPPNKKELINILKILDLEPRQLMRTHETEYKAQGLDNEALTVDQLIDAMIQHPKLIERPIVINNNRAAVGRPPENILEII
ncbi:MAG: arsenate reductase (glutaredoxin) [Gammaproteobacteria bacterium]|nr:arsenate reductase (glutaredoxin) [Gammaproteobacteria bacterium]